MKKFVTYKDSGHSLENSDNIINNIKSKLPHIGGFAGYFPISEDTTLVSSTDGVGTKLLLAIENNIYDKIGIDLVAMVVNDIITCGAKPLFLLDYIACGKLNPSIIEKVIDGIIEGCNIAKIKLIGGETAEMSGLYEDNHLDLAAFGVGSVLNDRLIDGSNIKSGDLIIGLKSSGLHSNGYSLARKIIKDNNIDLSARYGSANKTLLDMLLTPTIIYSGLIEELTEDFQIKGMANITGSGIPGNLERIIPDGLKAIVKKSEWIVPDVFNWISDTGPVEEKEMYNVFNMGIGYIVIVNKRDYCHRFIETCLSTDNYPFLIGEIIPSKTESVIIE